MEDYERKHGNGKAEEIAERVNVDKNSKVLKGLGTDENDLNIIPEHNKPKIINKIDFNDKRLVDMVIRQFEEEAVNREIETACVITRQGEVYVCYGTENRVFPDFDLGEMLNGAIVSHNHPEKYTEYSFSKDDFNLFQEYQLEILRSEDVKSKYELNRLSNIVDEQKSIFDFNSDEDMAHSETIIRDEKANVGYRRWTND